MYSIFMSDFIRSKLDLASTSSLSLRSCLKLWLMFLFVLATVVAAVCAVRVMPFTDGWYETLVYLEAHGRKAYADLDFPLPPMTLVFYRALEVITHGVLAANKLIGVGLSAIVAGITGLWVSKYAGTLAGIAAAAIAVLVETTFPVYIARDYHTLVALFSLASIATMTEAVGTLPRVRRYGLLIAAGILSWLLFMTKQNVGLVVVAGFVTCQMAITGVCVITRRGWPEFRDCLMSFVLYTAGVALGIAIFMMVFQPPGGLNALLNALVSTQSKGAPIYFATRIIHDTGNVSTMIRAFLMAASSAVGLAVLGYARNELAAEAGKLPPILRSIGRVMIFLAAATIFLVNVILRRDAWTTFDFLATAAIAAFLYDAFDWLHGSSRGRSLDQRFQRLALFGALIFANTMTASINTIGVGLLVAWYGAIGIDGLVRLSQRYTDAWRTAAIGGIAVAALLLFVRLETAKMLLPYSWWGVSEPPVISSTDAAEQPMLAGLHLNSWRKRQIDDVLTAIRENTKSNEPIFVYPNIPLFYRLSGRLPVTRTYIQWFDFAREESLKSDFARVSAAPPRIIVEMLVPATVYDGHAMLLGRPPIQRDFTDYLQCLVDTKAASVVTGGLYSLPGVTSGLYTASAEPYLTPREVRGMMSSSLLRAASIHLVGVHLTPDGPILGAADLLQTGINVDAYADVVFSGAPGAVSRVIPQLMPAGSHRLTLADQNAYLRVLRVNDHSRSHQPETCRSQLMERIDAPSTAH